MYANGGLKIHPQARFNSASVTITSTVLVPNPPRLIHLLGTTAQGFKGGPGLLDGPRSCEHQ